MRLWNERAAARTVAWPRIAPAMSLLFCVTAPSPMRAQTLPTLDDIRQLPATPWLGISPDGSRVAYLLSATGASSELWSVPADGGEAVPITREAGVRTVAGWSPNGEAIAFAAADGSGTALWTVRPGAEPRIACTLPQGARAFAWLGDGVRLTFAARAGSATAQQQPSPGDGVFVCDSRNGVVRQVTARGYFGLDFAWSPAGDRLAVSTQQRPGFYERLESDLLLVDPATGAETPLVTRPGIDRAPLWSPDGSTIAFVSGFGRSGLLANLGVAVIHPGDASLRDIGTAHDRGGFFEDPLLHAWSADGRDILYAVTDGVQAPLFRIRADGGPPERVTVPADRNQVTYQYSLSADGRRLAYKVSSLDLPPEIFTVRIGEAQARRVTRFHDGFAARGFARAERMNWLAPDSTPIEGLLLRPPASFGSGPFPLVTIMHGGPASAYNLSFPGLAFFDPYQDLHLAARGYAVFMPNPRGSGGYGERFRRAVRRDWGRGPAADVHAGIDRLIADGIADPTRLALTGWSYGGYLAAWMLAHSDRFAVGSVGAGVYDLTLHYGQGAPQLEEYFGGPPWRLPALYRDQSPVHYVARITTPTQIIHGEDDTAVSIAQAELLHAALRAEGVPTEFVRYPGEGHSLRQASVQDDSFERLLAWLERWLRPGRHAQSTPSVSAADRPADDVATLDGILAAYYDVISGPAGTAPDRARDAWLHRPDALVAITGVRPGGERSIRTMTLDEYHESFGGTRTTGFYEREVHRRIDRFGNIAHVWSTYESSREPDGAPFTRGINSIQLYHDGARWWITSWIFDSERRDNPIPAQYLPAVRENP